MAIIPRRASFAQRHDIDVYSLEWRQAGAISPYGMAEQYYQYHRQFTPSVIFGL
jgi:hypothetical protein